jgi:hypothetical protein
MSVEPQEWRKSANSPILQLRGVERRFGDACCPLSTPQDILIRWGEASSIKQTVEVGVEAASDRIVSSLPPK